jgi:hypothetical protein
MEKGLKIAIDFCIFNHSFIRIKNKQSVNKPHGRTYKIFNTPQYQNKTLETQLEQNKDQILLNF